MSATSMMEMRRPAPASPALQDVRLSTGVRLRYTEQGDPAGEAIVMLHGYSDSSFSFSPVLPLVSPRYHVFALDLRGHGGSDQPAKGYDIRDLAADVVAFLDAKGLPRATIVGHSLGSFVAQRIAVDAPARVSRLVLLGSAPTLRNEVIAELRAAVDTLSDPVPVEFVRDFQLSTVYSPLPDEFIERVVAESLVLTASVWQALAAGMLAETPVPLSAIEAPTLVLGGDRDAVFSRAEQQALAAGIRRASRTEYAETGHAVHWERPGEVVRAIEGFV